MFRRIRAAFRLRKQRKFLKRHGCSSWRQYHRMNDPDYNIRATKITDYYHGYPYWHVFENRDHYCYKLLYDYGPGGHRYGYHDIVEWCEKNIKHKHRLDFLRVFQQTPIGLDGPGKPEWWINEIGGGDHIFIAFKDPKDLLWFTMKWVS